MIGRPGSGLVTLLEETTFCISDASGDIVPGGAQGLFFRDTRFISRLELRLDGELPEPVAVQPNDPFRCTFLARRPPGPFKADSTLLLIRRRYVGNGMRDEITLRNLGHEPAAAHLTVAVKATSLTCSRSRRAGSTITTMTSISARPTGRCGCAAAAAPTSAWWRSPAPATRPWRRAC